MMRRVLIAAACSLAACSVADGAGADGIKLTFIAPTLGSISGGYTLNVYGDGFENATDLSCVFRDLGIRADIFTNATFVSGEKLTCIVPSVERAVQSIIYASIDGVNSVNGISFNFVDHAVITSIEPKSGPSYGGTLVKLHGSGFVNSNRLTCSFNKQSVQTSWISTEQLACQVPPQEDGSKVVNVVLKLNGVQFSSNHADFLFYNEPTPTSIEPRVGTSTGGTVIVVTGSGFFYSDSIFCRFGEVVVTGRYINEGAISCITPPQARGLTSLHVAVSLNGADYHRSATQYKYIDPVIRSIRPQKGYLWGGTKINVTGFNFEDTDQLMCVFNSPVDGQTTTKALYVSSTELECISPAVSEPGYHSIKVSLNGVDVSPSSANFIAAAPAKILSMTPESAATLGLSKLHLFGQGFLNGESTACRFGNSSVPAEWVSPTVVMCKPISLNPAAGYTTVSYTNDGVHFVDAESRFLFIRVPLVLSVTPRAGLREGGTTILFQVDEISTVLGWRCSFGGLDAQATITSSTEFWCRSPPSEEDVVPIGLFLREHDLEVKTEFDFRYHDALAIESIHPNSAPMSGDTASINVAIRGLREDSSYVCVFGDVEVIATVWSSSALSCNSPSLDYAETIPLYVKSVNTPSELTLMSNSITFTIYQVPKIQDVHPKVFYASHPPNLEVSGREFMDLDASVCRLNGQNVQVRWISSTKIICLLSEAALSLDSLDNPALLFSPNGVDFNDSGVKLRVLSIFGAVRIHPNKGSILGGMTTSVTGVGFDGSVRYFCHFGLDAVGAKFIDATSLTCVTPSAHHPNVRSFSLCTETGVCVGANITFTFTEPLTVVQLEPRRGPLEGGTLVRVKANQNLTNPAYCWFGEKRVDLDANGDDEGTCVSPPFGAETDTTQVVEFRASTAGHESSQGPFYFIYYPVHQLHASSAVNSIFVDPNQDYMEKAVIRRITPVMLVRGSPRSALVIEGENLLSNDGFFIDSCSIGPSDGSVAMIRDGSNAFRCESGELPSVGSYPVVFASERYGTSTAPNFKLHVTESPKLHRLEPDIVIPVDIVRFFVHGSGFVDHNLTCFLNEQSYPATFITSNQIICKVVGADLMTPMYEVSVSNDGEYTAASSLVLEVVPIPSVAELNPPVGLRGSNVTLRGKGFHPKMQCYADHSGVLESFFVNSSALQCTLPLEHQFSTAKLAVAFGGIPISNALKFTQIDLHVISMYPTLGTILGGTPVTFVLRETSIGVVRYCKFGETLVTAVIEDNNVMCNTPFASKASLARVELGVNERDFVESTFFFRYIPVPTFLGIKPHFGFETGGKTVQLLGSNFVDAGSIVCYFGETRVSGWFVSTEELSFITPALMPGNFSISVSPNDVDIIQTSLVYQVRLQVTTTFIRPQFGRMNGGTNIEVFGTNFRRDDDLACKFGETLSSALYIGPNVLHCITPPHEMAEAVEMGIVSESGDVSFVDGGFEYLRPFEVTALNPDNGPLRGGTNVSVVGMGFSRARAPIQCNFNGSASLANVISDEELICTAPSSVRLGEVGVSITHGADEFALTHHFSYEHISVNGVHMRVFSSQKHHNVTVHGSFIWHKRLACRLGDHIMVKASFVNEAVIICEVPHGLPPTEYKLAVTSNGQDFSESNVAIRVIKPYKVHNTEPKLGSSGITTSITLRGRGFEYFDGLECLVNNRVTAAQFVDSEEIQCYFPPVSYAGLVSVSLSTGGCSISNDLNFTFVEMKVGSIHPKIGSTVGGTPVAVQLDAGDVESVSHCKFGDEIVLAVKFGDELLCVTPSVHMPGPIYVSLSANGKDFETSQVVFEYHSPCQLLSSFPLNGPESGGTAVTLRGKHFIDNDSLACYFGEQIVAGQWMSETEIMCIAPSLKPGSYAIGTTMNGVDLLYSPLYFRSDHELDVAMIIPSIGINSGSTVTVLGKSFVPSDDLFCSFGEFGTTAATYVSPRELSCQSPDVEVIGLIDVEVRVSLNGIDFSSSSAAFRISPMPEIHHIHPIKGFVSGGDEVIVRGAHFIPGNLTSPMCMFGNQSVPAVVFSSTDLVCISPSTENDGEVDFAVSMNGVDKAVGYVSFLYLPTIKTFLIEPSSGPFTGNTLVTITGVDFTPSHNITCRFGDIVTDIIYLSDHQIQCITPSHPPGLVAFHLDCGDTHVDSELVFEFYMPHQIISAFPTTGSYRGGTPVKIHGRHFRSDVDYLCHFGNSSTSHAIFLSFESIECNSPVAVAQNRLNTVALTISQRDSNYTHDALSFTYAPFIILDRVQPRIVSFEGGTISLFGDHFNTSQVWCRFTLDFTSFVIGVGDIVNVDQINCHAPSFTSGAKHFEARVQISSNTYEWSDSLALLYVSRPIIKHIHPTLGAASGGTLVSIFGSNFVRQEELWCNFHGADRVRADWESSEKISCISPALKSMPSHAALTLHTADGLFISGGEHAFRYHRDLSLERVSPNRGFVTGGLRLTVVGTGFIDVGTIYCHFDNDLVNASFISSTAIECVTPSANVPQNTKLGVSLNGIDVVYHSGLVFEYVEQPKIELVVPDNVPVVGENAIQGAKYVSVFGSSFVNRANLRCIFGNTWITNATFINDSEVKCALPGISESGVYPISFSYNSGADSSQTSINISVVESALISSVHPSRIQEGSEALLTITGANFIASASLQCHFGEFGRIWTPAVLKSPSTLECKSPELPLTADGYQLISISNNGGYSMSAFARLGVSGRARFLSMYPSQGYTSGGTDVSIVLGYLRYVANRNMHCKFGGKLVRADVIGSIVSCVSPSNSRGKALVSLMIEGEIQPLASETFEYLDEPSIDRLHPSIGTLGGGTRVVLRGRGLKNVSHCRFDNNIVPVDAPSFDSEVMCTSPSVDFAKDVSVQVTHNGQDFASSSEVEFSYRAMPIVLDLMPSFGGANTGSKTVYVLGREFSPSPLLACRFGKSVVEATFISGSLISCKAPPMKLGRVSLAISLNQIDFTSNGLVYETINLPQISAIRPTVGPLSGNTTVVIDVTVLPKTDRLACHFGDRVVQATFLSINSLSCVAPVVEEAKTVDVSISVDGERLYEAENATETGSIKFGYVENPDIDSISPALGWTIGGTNISVHVKNLKPFREYDVACSFGGSGIVSKAIEVGDDVVICATPKFDDYMGLRENVVLTIGDGVNFITAIGPTFTYFSPAKITRIEPTFGSVDGGSLVRLSGHNFPNVDGLRCLFGNFSTSAEWIGDGQVLCTSSQYAGEGSRKVQVSVGMESNTSVTITSHASFEYLYNPIILDFNPKIGNYNGGTQVVLSLVHPWPNATNHLSCRFGSNSLLIAQVVSEDKISCIAPPKAVQNEIREVPLTLHATHGGRLLAIGHVPFVYMDSIKIHSLYPNSGPISGGTIVRLQIEGVDGVDSSTLSCHFGPAVSVSVTSCVEELQMWTCECSSPPVNASNDVLIEIGIDGSRDIPTVGKLFSYYEPPDIFAISPSTGFLEGGELVRLRGVGFRQSRDFKCMFGGLESGVIFMSSTDLFCTSPAHGRIEILKVRVSNNGGVDYSNGLNYTFMHRPDTSVLSPSVVEWDRKTTITITGKDLAKVTSCRFGDVERAYPVINVTDHMLTCTAPRASVYEMQQFLTAFNVPVYLSLENGLLPTGLDVIYKQPPVEEIHDIDNPKVFVIEPMYTASVGGSWIRIYGEGFVNGRNLKCFFGEVLASRVWFVSSSEILCMTPRHPPKTVPLRVINSGTLDSIDGVDFTFIHDFSISYVSPSAGSIRGGTNVNVYGSFPTSNVTAVCMFGSNGVVYGDVVTENHITCLSPKASMVETVELSLSIDGGLNFGNSTDWFTYELEAEVLDIHPTYGYRCTDEKTSILITGKNFRNVSTLVCMFGKATTTARFISSEKVSCIYPPTNDTGLEKVPVSVLADGDVQPSSWRHFEYLDPPTIKSYKPIIGGATIKTGEVTVRGMGFQKTTQLRCTFGDVSERAAIIDSTTVKCPIPLHPPGDVNFGVADLFSNLTLKMQQEDQPIFRFIPESSFHSIVPTWNASKTGIFSFVKGSNFESMASNATATLTTDLLIDSSANIEYYYGRELLVLEPKDVSPATNGTYTSDSSHNLTLCEPGFFQPRNGQHYCMLCPVGFVCPLFGTVSPIICPAGFICSKLGLSTPSSPCAAGHYCLKGTKMSFPSINQSTGEWSVNKITGLVTAVANADKWDYVPRESPATGSRRIFHPPMHTNVTAQQPFPCPLGHYCRVGVSTAVHGKGDFSTPQPCHSGRLCPRGSISSEGAGACPSGYYCTSQNLAIPCDIGHFCPGVGNTFPLPCFPGSYSNTTGQNNCRLCDVGYQCDGWGRSAPRPCKAGFICDQPGISIPEKTCPSGYYCEAGTSTDDPQNAIGKPPRPCPPGLFCLEGVARELPLEIGLPSFDMSLPQPCAEGYYCSGNASVPFGGGPCFQGHYCSVSSRYPIQVPPGTFAGEDGSIVPSLCLPGTFSPQPGTISCRPCPAGFSCLGYGTFTPRICSPGTYRSKADSIPCKLCPERTYSHESGLVDVSQCLPCLEGRVCGKSGLAELQSSEACPEGHACGYVTNRASQYDQKCAGGSFCANETRSFEQYSNYCVKGRFCQRGTSAELNAKGRCLRSHFCTAGASDPEHFSTRCPKQTKSNVGSEMIESCTISPVAVCDKKASTLTNPFNGISYYPTMNDGTRDRISETVVVKKVLPLNSNASNILPWKNNTAEVYRSCPSFGAALTNSPAAKRITVIGRNFRNTTDITCRFRLCRTSVLNYLGQELVIPNMCESDGANFSSPILVKGTFVSDNRVECQLPDLVALGEFEPVPITSLPQSKSLVCMLDSDERVFLSTECSNEEVASESCLFEKAIPSFGLRKRIYSLFMPCAKMDGSCRKILNPCLTESISVEISNDGKKFSGDATVVPYKSSGSAESKHDTYVINSTFAVYGLIRNETFVMTDNKTPLIEFEMENEAQLCSRPSMMEEGARLSDDGWFQSVYMTRVIMSFDWRHIPQEIAYNKHYKLAIYVMPSRCNEARCFGSERRHQVVENVPCLRPLELPVWFESEAVNKHQTVNLTMLSLDDALFKVEVQIINGLALSAADFFKRTMTITKEVPERARTFGDDKVIRNLSPLVSWEETVTPMHFMFGVRYDESMFDRVSPPMNLPPRWHSFERGRMLLSMNATHKNNAPTIKDNAEMMMRRSKNFWDNPFPSALTAKEQSDVYFETWHGVSRDESGSDYKYDHDSVILPFLPYFSNCREFDSYIPLWSLLESSSECKLPGVTAEYPEDWWRRQIPSLPHQDDVKAVSPRSVLDLNFYPIADWCERKLHCTFEENLSEPNVLPRWFEAETGETLFSVVRDPIDYFQYTGRDKVTIDTDDGGGQKMVHRTDNFQNYIPARVDRSPAFNAEGGCNTNCFPRLITLDISYHQIDQHTKRIVQVKLDYDRFDKDDGNDRYELKVKFYALDYQELIVKFAFSRNLFLLLFAQMGVGTIAVAFVYWIIIRVTTRLENPPSIRITGFFWRIFPPAVGGVVLGLMPISAVTFAVYFLLKGNERFGSDIDPEGRRWLLLPTLRMNYSDVTVDPDLLYFTRQGRTGFAFLSMALVSFYYTSRMFIPKKTVLESSRCFVSDNKSSDNSVTWRRSNLVYSSILMSLFLVVIVEWSFWGSFGTYIWEAIILMKFLSMLVGSLVDAQLGEALLSAPLMTAMGMVQGIVTMSANDFMDFLLSYIVGFGFLIIERMYIGPLQADFMTWLTGRVEQWSTVFVSKSQVGNDESGVVNDPLNDENNETVEMLLGSFANYSCDALSLLYTPFIMVVVMVFREETEIIKLYGIKEADMEYYILFATCIIPFQCIADILLHNSLELLHGWRTLDYLEYCRVRFYQRGSWWKGFQINTLDKCIEESLRSIDQLCFSSQYYMLNTIHVNAIMYFVIGVVMMNRAKYNLFGDPAMMPIVGCVLICSLTVRLLLIWVGRILGVWRVRFERRDWHSRMRAEGEATSLEELDDVQTENDHNLYQIEMRITDETFRYKFLRYNRPWIIHQLPDMLTPRIVQRSRPYMINQLARIMGSINTDISSDSEDDDNEFDIPVMSVSTRTIVRKWLMQASRLMKLRRIVQPIIQQSKGNACAICLNRNSLVVAPKFSIEQIDEMFCREYGNELDHVLFQRFWRKNQSYTTICHNCAYQVQNHNFKHETVDVAEELDELTNGLSESSTRMMALWYDKARERLS